MTLVKYPESPVLIVDDDPTFIKALVMTLRYDLGITNVCQVQNGQEALALLKMEPFSLVLLDLNMPEMSGVELLRIAAEEKPDLPILIVSGMNQLEQAVECMRLGAYDYYVKGAEKERLLKGVERALMMRSLRQQSQLAKGQAQGVALQDPASFAEIITADTQMLGLCGYIESVAGSREPLMITGESGTGKELFAHAVHKLSRADKPWVAVNAAGLDEHVFSDTLFGHVRGAYTGGDQRREGLIAKAGGGTLFLDEIGDLSIDLQVKLLRILQEGTYYPLGSDKICHSQARIVVASNRNLRARVAEGTFRKDLYYRLSTHHVHIPALRDRPGDIPLLLDHFLTEAASQFGRKVPTLAASLIDGLCRQAFPGNVRQLRSVVFNALARSRGQQLTLHDFMLSSFAGEPEDTEHAAAVPFTWTFPPQLPTLAEMTGLLVSEALLRSGNNQTKAGAMLGISQQAMSKRLKNRG